MIVRNFMIWAQKAPAAQRADATAALARAYLFESLDEATRRDAETALTSLLDDPSPLVRRALSESLASALDAPHALVFALAYDQSDVAAPLLSRSPALSDAELIDCAAVGDVFAQSAIAVRARLSAGVAAALAEIGAREAVIALAVNPGADLFETTLRRMIERFGDDGELREALLSRHHLPASIRSRLAAAAAAALTSFALDRAWLSPERAKRLERESRDKANLIIVASAGPSEAELREFAAHLCESGALTPSFLLRALLSGQQPLFAAALAELSGARFDKALGLTREGRGAGFAALYVRAGLPEKFLPAFRAALSAAPPAEGAGGERLILARVRQALAACDQDASGELARLIALLRRFEAEAALDEARLAAPALWAPIEPDPASFAPLIDMVALEADLGLDLGLAA